METKNTDHETPHCLACKSCRYVIPIIYGRPTKELLEQWSKGEIELGGSLMINDSGHQWTCMRCKIFVDAPKEIVQQESMLSNPA